jgi:transposase
MVIVLIDDGDIERRIREGPVAGLVGIDGGVVSGVMNLESSGVEAPDWRPRHDEHYHEA